MKNTKYMIHIIQKFRHKTIDLFINKVYNNIVIWGIWQRWGATRAPNNEKQKKEQYI